jgi:uncharacterized membrane protein
MLKSPWVLWGAVLGFALGGFFDGILLHQILQWHHLLSLVPGLADLRVQVLWDGYFHALMYLVALAGLWGLWRARRRAMIQGLALNGAPLAGALLVGFGVWHVIDGILSHWILGIHRIKLDSPSPLAWDLFWLAVFGLAPLAIGRVLLQRRVSRPGGPVAVVWLLAALTGSAGAWALREPPGQRFTTVVFAPGASPAQVFDALDSAGARLVWSDRSMGVVVVAVRRERRWDFYRHGALLVGGTALAAGCSSWSRA